ncbi:MAG TPA: tetratricopeptide repeat protein [Candidatus Sumerlaeota bacterium]|nr:tetratricopeptide repeat protein [Candidatus Sumerlaeota bacterium]
MICERLKLALLCVIALVLAGCKPPSGQANQKEEGEHKPEPSFKLRDLPQSDAILPIVAVWGPVVEEGVNDELQEQAAYFSRIVADNIGFGPEPLLDVFEPLKTNVLFPLRGSVLYKPLVQRSDAELIKASEALQADYNITIAAFEEDSKPVIEVRLLDMRRAVAWQQKYSGTWVEIGEKFGHDVPELLKAMGVEVTEAQRAVVSHSPTGDGVIFAQLAKKRENLSPESVKQLRDLVTKWGRKDPLHVRFHSLSLINNYTDSAPNGKQAIIAELNDGTKPFNGLLAIKWIEMLSTKKDYQDSRAFCQKLMEAYPNWRSLHTRASYAAYVAGDLESATRILAKARKLGCTSWLLDTAEGDVYRMRSYNAQRGRTTNNFSQREMEDFISGNRGSIQFFEAALKKNPNSAYAMNRLADSYLRSGEDQEKIFKLCEGALDVDAGHEDAIGTMLWSCAPGYNSRMELGRKLIIKYQDRLKTPGSIAVMASAILQNMRESMQGYTQEETFDACERDPMAAEASGFVLLRMLYLEEKEINQDLLRSYLFTTAQMLEYVEAEPSAENLKPLMDRWREAPMGNNFERQWTMFNGGTLMERGGELSQAREMYTNSANGPDPQMQQLAKGRLAILKAKEGDVAGALADLDRDVKTEEHYEFYRMEILTLGSPEQLQEAIVLGEKVVGTKATWGSASRLAEAYMKANKPRKVIDLFAKEVENKEKVPLSLQRRYNAACKALGISPDLPPKEAKALLDSK